MKITDIKTFVVNARLRNWIFVRVETDQPGLYGLGEATLEFQTRAVVGAIQDLALLIKGEDPRRIEHLWQTMFRHPFFKGGIVTMSALSGIDQALHDLKAKDLGIPLWQLIGGLTRDRLRMYDHLGGGDSGAEAAGEGGGGWAAGDGVGWVPADWLIEAVLRRKRSRPHTPLPRVTRTGARRGGGAGQMGLAPGASVTRRGGRLPPLCSQGGDTRWTGRGAA